jgi:hypothetical protein
MSLKQGNSTLCATLAAPKLPGRERSAFHSSKRFNDSVRNKGAYFPREWIWGFGRCQEQETQKSTG